MSGTKVNGAISEASDDLARHLPRKEMKDIAQARVGGRAHVRLRRKLGRWLIQRDESRPLKKSAWSPCRHHACRGRGTLVGEGEAGWGVPRLSRDSLRGDVRRPGRDISLPSHGVRTVLLGKDREGKTFAPEFRCNVETAGKVAKRRPKQSHLPSRIPSRCLSPVERFSLIGIEGNN